MIVKKVKSSRVKSKSGSIRDLTNYIGGQERTGDHEKVLYISGRGFICDDYKSQQSEMVALACEAVRSKNPVNHYIISWREGEQPSVSQVEEAVSIFMEELGLKNHQALYALHKDTDNIHLHVAINRVHPDTLKVVEINKGFDLEAAHAAIARIEHSQGWEREQNGRYQVLENGELGRAPMDQAHERLPSQRKRDMEHRTGEKSAHRIAIEQGAAILREAKSWQELHKQLAEKGMRYERAGSGAKIFVGDVPVKASNVDRLASLGQMQKRLGIYEPPQEALRIDAVKQERESVKRPPEPLKQNIPGWAEYITSRKAHYAAKEAATTAQRKRQDAERAQLSERQRKLRERTLAGNWKGRGELRNAVRSVVAARQAAEKAALKERHRQERAQVRQQYPPYPNLEQWQRRQKQPRLAEQWRYRASEPQRIEGDTTEAPTLRDIRAYVPGIFGEEVHYTRKDQAMQGAGASFVDKGRRIEINDWRQRDSTLAALQLSAQKWGSFKVAGNSDYKAMCAQLAAQHGFNVTNPELQEQIKQEREQMQQLRVQQMKPEQLKQFEKYANAIGAERYRVTSIRMKPDGGKMTFILDKKDGITKGFTPQEIAQRTAEMRRLEKRGENIYYTPLSENKHHILIDDMSSAKLDKLVQDGYKPAIVLESSPGNYQAIITIPKLGTSFDRDVSNRLSERLNKEYGDPKLLGCIHPHRAPGYENRKPKHERADGGYPQVRLVKAERCECAKALALSNKLDADLRQQEAERAQQPGHVAQQLALNSAEQNISAVEAYQRHCRDVLKRHLGSEVDLSRVDSMIAVRMRVTGHIQDEIEEALRQCAPALRSKEEERDWNDYAKRTARYAYSVAGERQAAALGKYRTQWQKLEGQEGQITQRGIGRDSSEMSR